MTSAIYSDLWKRDLGSGRYVVMSRSPQDYRAKPGGHLHAKLQQLHEAVDQVVESRASS